MATLSSPAVAPTSVNSIPVDACTLPPATAANGTSAAIASQIRALQCTIDPSIPLFQQYPHLKNCVSVALQRAVSDVINPVVDRTSAIAFATAKEITLKDFAQCTDETEIRTAARLMASNLAGSLALVTCKEPLSVSMQNHLRCLLAQSKLDAALVDSATKQAAEQNLSLGCSLIEKTAIDKAVRKTDDALVARRTRFSSC
eukprot:gnl/Hemi2/24832_TR8347_c0_g1_i1.p1 gnl/Hemi2/24832_TR8347_c0_g1~~gnl/Hemi2/24832_TR8347_c0_g1_i1.p1  ORF type:complete len:201 (+),score=26.45 gnl/Hemi2/24832_TR8347_c0_g1_i1:207-809(+)